LKIVKPTAGPPLRLESGIPLVKPDALVIARLPVRPAGSGVTACDAISQAAFTFAQPAV
jgi:hypothetical protein